jgi:hypothetical protein
MADQPAHAKPMDPGRVELMDPMDIDYWCRQFGCTEAQITDAVAAVGSHVTAVREELQRQRNAGS